MGLNTAFRYLLWHFGQAATYASTLSQEEDVHMRNELAAFGGRPAVTTVPPTQWPSVSKEEILAVVGLLVNNTISIYDRSYPIDALEDSFAAYIGRRYAIAFNSGTAALFARH